MRLRVLIISFGLGNAVFGQLGPAGAGGTSGSSAVQLPLSGRGGQSGGVSATQTPLPGITSSINTLNSTVQVTGPYSGSVPAGALGGPLTLDEAVRRGIQQNLGATGLNLAVRQARGQSRSIRSALMPNLNSSLRESVLQNDLAASGIRSPKIPGLGQVIPTVTPPFNYFDLRATLTQTIGCHRQSS